MSNRIKDAKVRKAVRAWAETVFEWGKWTENKIRVGYEGDDIYCFKIFDCLLEVPLSKEEDISEGEYTIDELCGEIACEPVREMEGWRKNDSRM